MHTLLGLASLLLVVLGGYLTLALLHRLGGWADRRDLQFFVLAVPLVSLGVGVAGLHHFAGQACFLGAPPWDYTLGLTIPLGMGLVALGGLGLGLTRVGLLHWLVARRGVPADGELQALADGLAQRLGAPRPRVLVCAYDRPLALTSGVIRPTLLLSTWTIEHLDRRELEAVLAHELAHVARRDYPAVWLATVLRDAFCYLPTSWAAYRQLQREKELACDDLAAAITGRPLALASALAKVWHQAVSPPRLGMAQLLVDPGVAIEGRIARLIAPSGSAGIAPQRRRVAFAVGGAGLAGLLVVEALNVAVMLAPMGCGPISRLGAPL